MELTPEQLVRIEQNRQRAILLRIQKKNEIKVVNIESCVDSVDNIVDSSHPTENTNNYHYRGYSRRTNDSANLYLDIDTDNCASASESLKSINTIHRMCQHVVVNDLNQHVQCSSLVIDMSLYEAFNEIVCYDCKRNTDQYDLLTKSEATKIYLIPTDAFSSLKYKEQSNPHRPGWNAMKLYLRKHVMALSLQRFGSEDALAKEKKHREEKRYEREVGRTRNTLTESTSELWSSFNDIISKSSLPPEATTCTEPSRGGHHGTKSNKRGLGEYDPSECKAATSKTINGRKKVILGDLVDIIRGSGK